MLLITVGLLGRRTHGKNESQLFASVVVIARNEEDALPRLLESLTRLKYPAERYEIILLDDGSTDRTGQLMVEYATRYPHWKALQHDKRNAELKGKKDALTRAVGISRGSIILTTDADCRVPSNWIGSVVSCFTPRIGMVLGNSPVIRKRGLLNIYQRFDNLCEASLAAATAYYNNPSHSNARNLAFRKDAFQEAGGYAEGDALATGDDYFLTRQIRTQTKWKFRYNLDPESFVYTEEPVWGRRYIHQQLRRNSKAFHLTPAYFLMGAVVVLCHFILALLLLMPSRWPLLGCLLLGKLVFEFVPTLAGARLFGQLDLLKYFPVLWVVYPFLYLTTQLIGSLHLYRWK